MSKKKDKKKAETKKKELHAKHEANKAYKELHGEKVGEKARKRASGVSKKINHSRRMKGSGTVPKTPQINQ